jgi:hypothetical protein
MEKKLRAYQVARRLGMRQKDLAELAKLLDINLWNPLASVSEEEYDRLTRARLMIRELHKLAPASGSAARELDKSRQPATSSAGPAGFPRFWELFGYLLPRKTRERVYEPVHQELLEDYFTACPKYPVGLPRSWLSFCFTFRTMLLVADCFRALATDRAAQFVLRLIPGTVKQWWKLS